MHTPKYERIVIKVGSNVLSHPDGTLDANVIGTLGKLTAQLKSKQIEVILVTSGAVASGRTELTLPADVAMVSKRQIWAAVGQVKLMQAYYNHFNQHCLKCGQVLVTKEDFRDKGHYFNMQNCIETMIAHEIIPVINENDVVSVTELMFTDNDELAGLIASMSNADALFILTNVDGIYDGDPSSSSSSRIPVISWQDKGADAGISASKSSFGRGGMLTKFKIARKVASQGIYVHIVHGKQPEKILKLIFDDWDGTIGTTFLPSKKTNAKKKRLAFSESFASAQIHINKGAVEALRSNKATSILPIGVTAIKGNFEKHDLIHIIDEAGNLIGVGKASYSSKKLQELMGKKQEKEIVHYDYLYLLPF